MCVLMAVVLGMLGPPESLIEPHYVRIEDPAELPDMARYSLPGSSGARIALFATAKYGWHPGRGDVRGKARIAAVLERLGPPMELVRTWGVQRGYVWRHRRLDRPHAGIMIIVDERGEAVQLRSWSEIDRARGYTGRVGVAGENDIYRWFDWLTTPLTAAEAAAAAEGESATSP